MTRTVRGVAGSAQPLLAVGRTEPPGSAGCARRRPRRARGAGSGPGSCPARPTIRVPTPTRQKRVGADPVGQLALIGVLRGAEAGGDRGRAGAESRQRLGDAVESRRGAAARTPQVEVHRETSDSRRNRRPPRSGRDENSTHGWLPDRGCHRGAPRDRTASRPVRRPERPPRPRSWATTRESSGEQVAPAGGPTSPWDWPAAPTPGRATISGCTRSSAQSTLTQLTCREPDGRGFQFSASGSTDELRTTRRRGSSKLAQDLRCSVGAGVVQHQHLEVGVALRGAHCARSGRCVARPGRPGCTH